jgi:serine/threonine protein kinase
MSLASGQRLGPYEIVAPLGAGGMGEVYRALDTRLRREVAVKVLPGEVGAHPDRLRRFEQEARAAAALNHPGVLAVHDFGVEAGAPYLVTELLQGETLREALGRGPLPLAKALALARQLLDALATAHEHGIVHRDLKPENVFLTRAGQAKILDFGLAKLTEVPGSDLANAPTVAGGTQTGMVVGTAGYMAPEQVRGVAVDQRADLFAMGVVLYECLTGERPFHGASAVETLHAILRDEPPPLSTRVATLPAGLDAVVARALAKETTARFQSARDLLFALEQAAAVPASAERPAAEMPPPRSSRWPLVAAAVATAVAIVFAAVALRRETAGPPVSTTADFTTGTLTPLTTDPGYEAEASFLPDGETLAYVSDSTGNYEIYLQQVAGGRALNLTNNPADEVQPAVSPDGRTIAFVSSRSGRDSIYYATPRLSLTGGDVWAMPTLGGRARLVAEAGNFPRWSPDGGTIYFIRARWYASEIRRVAAAGGASERVAIDFGDFAAPLLLHLRISSDGRWLAFQAGDAIFTAPSGGGRATRVAVGRDPEWEPGGAALLYCDGRPGRNFALWRQPLDATAAPIGTPTPALVGPSALAAPALARSGRRLAIAAVERVANLFEQDLDVETGRAAGTPRALTRGRNEISFASLSPDGRSIAYEASLGATSHLWRLDLGREPEPLIADPAWSEGGPRWSPDGRWIAFGRRPAGEPRQPDSNQLWVMRPDGGEPRRVANAAGNMAWLPDSRRVFLVHRGNYKIVDVESGAETPVAIEGEPAMPIFAVSPDGAEVVYQTPIDGNVELMLVPSSGGRARPLVRGPGMDGHPSFGASGRWLYFQVDHRDFYRIPGPAQGWRPAPPERMTSFPASGAYVEEPMVAADERRIVYARVETAADLWIVDVAEPEPAVAEPGGS